jgi:ABC-type lipoprotein export system ATPase subunit
LTSDVLSFEELRERAARAEPEEFGRGAQIVCDNLVKIYKVADLEVVALQGFDLVVERGDLVAIVGASGSGKSTLMNILGGLDTPSAGRAVVAGNDLLHMTDGDRLRYRRQVVGFVWQQTSRNLLPYLTAAENVELPMILAGMPGSRRRRRTHELLEVVGLGGRARHRPDRLSGGEQQRVAIATALANGPAVLLADEPTGELDNASSEEVLAVFQTVSVEMGVSVIVATHDPLVSTQVARTVGCRDGRASSEVLRHSVLSGVGERVLVAEELAVLDRAGRLQLPPDYVAALDLESRVRLKLERDHVGVWPDRDRDDGTESVRP